MAFTNFRAQRKNVNLYVYRPQIIPTQLPELISGSTEHESAWNLSIDLS